MSDLGRDGMFMLDDGKLVEQIARETFGTGVNGRVPTSRHPTVVSFEDFAAVKEDGAKALVGTEDAALIPEDGDVMVYGDGGAGKTTLTMDLGLHLAAGDEWLGIPIARPVRVLVLENEGPRPLFRRKIARKLRGWAGSPLNGRISILSEPWGEFSFAGKFWLGALAATIRDERIDVLIAGPVTRLGMDEAGTLQHVRDFMGLIRALRRESGRLITVVLVHHENKGGTVSGAWEGAGDTLLHVEARGPGHTRLHVQKARWSSEDHGATMHLAWTDGEGFELVEGERDYVPEIEALLSDGKWRTAKEVANKSIGGIGAAVETVKGALSKRPDIFAERKGNEVGRSANATVYGLTSGQKSDESDGVLLGTDGEGLTSDSPVRESEGPRSVPTAQQGLTSAPKSDESDQALADGRSGSEHSLTAEPDGAAR